MATEKTSNDEKAPAPSGKSMYSYIADAWKNPSQTYIGDLNKQRRIAWRREENFCRIDKPTRLDRARALGYKAKQGYVLVRGRVKKGSFGKRQIKSGRRAKRKGILKITGGKNFQRVIEERTQARYPNLEVLNSYWVGENGQYVWYEVILVDWSHPVIQADPKINWICYSKHKGRPYRGLTSAGTRGRGLRNKGKGAEKVRPSIKSKGRRGK